MKLENYLTEKTRMDTVALKLIQRYRSAENIEDKLNVATAISLLSIAVLLENFSLASRALAVAKLKINVGEDCEDCG